MNWRERWERFDPIWKFALAGAAVVTATFALFNQISRFERRLDRAGVEIVTTYISTLETRELLMRWRLEEIERELQRDPSNRIALVRRDELLRLMTKAAQERDTLVQARRDQLLLP